jgi:hypothetical protein
VKKGKKDENEHEAKREAPVRAEPHPTICFSLEKRSSVYLESTDSIERHSSPQWIGALKLVINTVKAWTIICLITFGAFGDAMAEPDRSSPPTVARVLDWWTQNAEVNGTVDGKHFHHMITPAHVHIDLKAQEVHIDVDSEGGQNIYAFAVFK